MDSDEGKLFIGGIAWDTTEETLGEYFNQYGDVSQIVIMRDKATGRPRGFAFVVFSDPSVLDRVLQDSHSIDGRNVEAKRALSREEQQHTSFRSGNLNGGRGSNNGGNFKTKKIFVGGLPSTVTEEGFRQYFEDFGHVTDAVVMYDQHTHRPRGFGFITFDTEDAVDRALNKSFYDFNGKFVEVKRALPKDSNTGGGYHGYGASSGNTSSFGGRMDRNRYMQSQTSAGGYTNYSGYGAPNYGYGAVNSGLYGGYGSYGVGGYGSGSIGFGGPAGAYGMPGALKTTWGSQVPSSYGVNADQSQYGNHGYGYGNYGRSDGHYYAGNAPNSGIGDGDTGGEQQWNGDNYTGSGYEDTNSGYVSESRRSNPSYASGGYDSAHLRKAPQQ